MPLDDIGRSVCWALDGALPRTGSISPPIGGNAGFYAVNPGEFC
jgi:hypothetical protein